MPPSVFTSSNVVMLIIYHISTYEPPYISDISFLSYYVAMLLSHYFASVKQA